MPKLRLRPQLLHLRYGVVAGFCLVLHNAIMIGADKAGLDMWRAACLSFVIMVVTGYLLLAAFVFGQGRSWAGFLRYTGAMAANFPFSTGLLWLFFHALGQPMAIAAPAATLVMVLVNYLASRWAIAGRRGIPA